LTLGATLPAVVSKGTLQEALFVNNLYLPVSLWSIIELITQIRTSIFQDQEVRIGARHDMDQIVKVPALYETNSTFEEYDYIVYDAIQKFNQHQDLMKLFSSVAEYLWDFDTQTIKRGTNFTKWRKNFKETTSIENYIEENKVKIASMIEANKKSYDYSLFHTELKRVLDTIEEEDSSKEESKKIFKKSKKGNNVSNDIQLFINSHFSRNTKFDEWRPRVVSYTFENDLKENLRINIDLINLNDNKMRYDVWVLVPTK